MAIISQQPHHTMPAAFGGLHVHLLSHPPEMLPANISSPITSKAALEAKGTAPACSVTSDRALRSERHRGPPPSRGTKPSREAWALNLCVYLANI